MRPSTEKKLEEFKRLYEEGNSRLDIMAKMGFKSSQTYYVYLEMMRNEATIWQREMQPKAKREPQYAPVKEPKAVPVTIKGKRYLDVTSYFV